LVQSYQGGKFTHITPFVSGTQLGAVSQCSGKVILFHNPLTAPTTIATMKYDGKTWSNGVTVVK
jgi:hypothetical protein